jgi:AcrR family transcriptional regulator
MPPPTEMFVGWGFDAARVSEVAKACEVSEATVYDYFPSKESLVLDRLNTMMASVGAGLRRNTPLVESLRRAIKGPARRRSVVLA